MAPIPKRDESDYDAFGVGHSSTSGKGKNYEEVADEEALEMIARQIYTVVYYDSRDTLIEENDKTIKNGITVIKRFFTMAEIPGAIKEDWKITGEKIYYVLCKLDNQNHFE